MQPLPSTPRWRRVANVSEKRQSDARLERDLRRAAERLVVARRLVVFTGAGVSKESGIATFRDPGEGLWAKYDPMQLATREAFVSDPQLVWSWYRERFGKLREARPNPGHVALAELERHVPSVIVVTQNIDALHQDAGSSDVIELHGSARRFKCLTGDHGRFTWDDVAAMERVAAAPEQGDAATHDVTATPDRVAVPRCPRCGDLIRPDVVWFGETLPHEAITRASEVARVCDVMLVVGTSGVVYPAASVPATAARAGAFLIDVNPRPDELSGLADVFLQGPGGEVLPRLAEELARLLAATP
jgi:NAD-dependent deacetylase